MPHCKIVCEPLSTKAVTKIIAGAIQYDTEDPAVQELAEIVRERCAGNPFFVMQYMEQLVRVKQLWYAEPTKKYEWDSAAIVAGIGASANPDIVDILLGKISSLSRSAKAFLLVFAQVGHTVEEATMAHLLSNPSLVNRLNSILDAEGPTSRKIDLNKAIKQSLKAGLIEEKKEPGNYKFVHDRVQQAAMRLIDKNKSKKSTLSTLGEGLLSIAKSKTGKDWMMFSATNLLIKNRGSLGRGDLGRLCLDSARKSYLQAAFASAASFADGGIDVLGALGWKDYYEITIELYNIAIEAHFVAGYPNKAKKRIKVVKENSKRLDDTFLAYNTSVKIKIVVTREPDACLDECVRGINLLGFDLARKPGLISALSKFYKLKRKISRGGSPRKLIESLPRIEDEHTVEAMSLSADIINAAYIYGQDDNLLMVAGFLSMELTLKYGLCEWGPFAILTFGYVLPILSPSSLSDSYELGLCSYELAVKTKDDLARTTLAFFNNMSHLRKPLKLTIAKIYEAAEIAQSVGDSLILGACVQFNGAMCVFCGQTLDEAKR